MTTPGVSRTGAAVVRVAAPAKINLYLHVVGRRPDGYHLLDSLVAFADIADIVTAQPADDLTLAIDGRFATALRDIADNLALRAARLLAERFGVTAGAALHLTKHLPVASGIGGGSSDAAATVRALCALWRIDAGENALGGLATRLGADVPVCLLGRTAWLGGIGDALAPAPPLPPVAIVLANPGVALSTQAVFRARRGAFSAASRFDGKIADAAGLAAMLSHRRNDLTEAAIDLVPEIGAVLARLAGCERALLIRMSGSGATCFALFPTIGAARAAASRVAGERPDWWVAPGWLGVEGRPRGG
jgi:4-diphosphocytidyl-2-C-methyl-D-erythritol kinase